MASNPPFLVEDQTDEDFFDKLVEDDDDFKVTTTTSVHSLKDGNDPDEVKAFANLSIGQVAAGSDDKTRGGTEAKEEPIRTETKREGSSDNGDVSAVSVDGHVEKLSSLESSNSFEFDGLIGSNDTGVRKENEAASDSRIGNDKLAGAGSKEVQWTTFGADSGQNTSNGFGSYFDLIAELEDAPTGKVEDNFSSVGKVRCGTEEVKTTYDENYSHTWNQENEGLAAPMVQDTGGQDVNSVEYWENLYPGWKYDPNTGQWFQVDGYEALPNVQGSFDSHTACDWSVLEKNSQVSYLQQTAQPSVGAVTDGGMTDSVTNWNQSSHESGKNDGVTDWNQGSQESIAAESISNWNLASVGNNEYPSHMVFDPQYPGWYYDTIAQEWRELETYTSSTGAFDAQSTIQAHGQQNQNEFVSTATFSHENDQKSYGDYGQVNSYSSEGFYGQSQSQDSLWAGTFGTYNQQALNIIQPENISKSGAPADLTKSQMLEKDSNSNFFVPNHTSQQAYYDFSGTNSFSQKVTQDYNDFTRTATPGFVPSGNLTQEVSQPSMQLNEHVPNNYYDSQNSVNFSQQQFRSTHQFSQAPNMGRSSAGRPPHALVTFGFGGKLIVMKDGNSTSISSYGSQGSLGGSISVFNLMEVVMERIDQSSMGIGVAGYFNTLCRQSFPGPLVGGNVSSKELNRWIDERIANSESSDMEYRKSEVLKLLFSLLKISCQHYGKLRSPFGTDSASREIDGPEAAVARLFAAAKRNGAQFSDYGALTHCLHKLPSEGQMRATAAEVQGLLVSGRKKEALNCATEGQLWGPALVLAAQLGDQFYVETVRQMALCQLVAGSPLRTLCLLIAGQPRDVFSTDTTSTRIPGAANMFLQPAQGGSNGLLDDWEENLAVITANRTKDDELVLIHLGDCLWKDRSEIVAAHICYLVAEANFEPYSDSARLCLVGADHWKFPRTFASPDAIQRTELYEYSKVLGNPQFILLPFQPYKLIYAHMLTEVGKISESLKYCQAILKSLKTGRASEVDLCKQLVSSLEERIRTHQQSGYSASLAPAKLVGKLINLFDTTAQRVVGDLPPPVPSTSQSSNAQAIGQYNQSMGPRVSTSQSTLAMSSLMPSASMEPIIDWTAEGNKATVYNRSVSEPDFSRSPRHDQTDSSKEATLSTTQDKASVTSGTSRFSRFSFGSQLLQKTVGLVLRPRQGRQAKLGEKNKFYYDEKLKRWVEEGAEPPAEETVPPPPPTTSAFQNGMPDYNLKNALKSEESISSGTPEFKSPAPSEHGSRIPPMPPSNQFSARGRAGVRSRYVDTFNKGVGNQTNLFQSPSLPAVKPTSSANPKFFVPTPIPSSEQIPNALTDPTQETATVPENSSIPSSDKSLNSLAPVPLASMQRFPSMDSISNKGTMVAKGSLSSHSRRTASWSGSLNDPNRPPQTGEVKTLAEVFSIPSSSSMNSEHPLGQRPTNVGSSTEDLHEVEL
ncbi:hypothetical protein NMG60_11030295 [Bertholletia excelsa]